MSCAVCGDEAGLSMCRECLGTYGEQYVPAPIPAIGPHPAIDVADYFQYLSPKTQRATLQRLTREEPTPSVEPLLRAELAEAMLDLCPAGKHPYVFSECFVVTCHQCAVVFCALCPTMFPYAETACLACAQPLAAFDAELLECACGAIFSTLFRAKEYCYDHYARHLEKGVQVGRETVAVHSLLDLDALRAVSRHRRLEQVKGLQGKVLSALVLEPSLVLEQFRHALAAAQKLVPPARHQLMLDVMTELDEFARHTPTFRKFCRQTDDLLEKIELEIQRTNARCRFRKCRFGPRCRKLHLL